MRRILLTYPATVVAESEAINMSGAMAMMEQMRAMLQQAGMPVTTENLNRASMALARGETLQAGAPRSMQSRGRHSQLPMPPPPTPGQGGDFAGEANPLEAAVSAMLPEDTNARVAAANANTPSATTQAGEQAMPPGADLMAGFPGTGDATVPNNMTAGDAVGTMLLPAAALLGMGPAGGVAGARVLQETGRRAAATQAGQARAALRDRAIRGINRDRSANNDPRGQIGRTRTERRMQRDE